MNLQSASINPVNGIAVIAEAPKAVAAFYPPAPHRTAPPCADEKREHYNSTTGKRLRQLVHIQTSQSGVLLSVLLSKTTNITPKLCSVKTCRDPVRPHWGGLESIQDSLTCGPRTYVLAIFFQNCDNLGFKRCGFPRRFFVDVFDDLACLFKLTLTDGSSPLLATKGLESARVVDCWCSVLSCSIFELFVDCWCNVLSCSIFELLFPNLKLV